MQLPASIRSNLRFMLVEVSMQLKQLELYFEEESAAIGQRLIERSGYAYTLKQRIQNSCTVQLAQAGGSETLTLRTVATIANDLERITQLCRNCIQHIGYLRAKHLLDLSVYKVLLAPITMSVSKIEEALLDRNTELALKLGHSESKLDASYQQLLKKYTRELKRQKHPEDLVVGLFVAHSIEQMGNALLSISESIISSNIGQPMDVQRFCSLRDTVTDWFDGDALANLNIRQVAETKSGSGISSINYVDANNDEQLAIFKDGAKNKLKEELQGVESWHAIYPGVAPQVLKYKKSGNKAALLIEHLQGMTFEHIVLNAPQRLMKTSLVQLGKTLSSVWTETRSKKSVAANFINQIRRRLPDVYEIHPSFKQRKSTLCGLTKPSYATLLKQTERLEKKIQPPFSVFIHGDFNVDNIIYDPGQKKINFIDLHRSKYMDYVQDVSVFMVSNYRLQVMDAASRKRINKQVMSFYVIARKFAKKNKDHTFELRLALGLARSFVTSTRFILDKSMANRMFLRSRYILELVLQADVHKPEAFSLPLKEIFSD